MIKPQKFQSTQPKRAATWLTAEDVFARIKISIHAAQEGCDWQAAYVPAGTLLFQSTQPKRAATATVWR